MTVLDIIPSTMRTNANNLESLRQQDMELIRKMRALVMSLNEVWKGSAEEAFVDNFMQHQNSMNEFYSSLEEFINVMNTACNKAEEADQELLSMVGKI